MSGGNEFGIYLRRARLEKGLSLRKFCLLTGEDPGNMSRIERGKLPPPDSREKLDGYASALGLIKESEQAKYFFDLAQISRGNIPQDVLDDRELAMKLPLVFRTLRGEKVERDLLREIAEMVRKD